MNFSEKHLMISLNTRNYSSQRKTCSINKFSVIVLFLGDKISNFLKNWKSEANSHIFKPYPNFTNPRIGWNFLQNLQVCVSHFHFLNFLFKLLKRNCKLILYSLLRNSKKEFITGGVTPLTIYKFPSLILADFFNEL